MSSSDPFPTRVLVIAGGIVVLLGLLLWFVSGLGSPTQPIPELEEEEVVEPLAPATKPDAEAPEPPLSLDGMELAPGVPTDVATEPVTLELFAIQPGSMRLSSRIRRLRAPMTLAAQAHVALEELVRMSGGLSPLPPGTVIREVWVSPAGIAYVDFAAGFPDLLPQGSLGELHAVYGVVATLTRSFPNIRAVQILVDGEAVDTLTGHLDTAAPFPARATWVY